MNSPATLDSEAVLPPAGGPIPVAHGGPLVAPRPARNLSVQILRAAAALMVVHVHALFTMAQFVAPRQATFYGLANFGSCGVDIFFAISGFILSTVTLNMRTHQPARPHSAFDFLVRRAIRIFPIYWVLTLFFVIVEARHHTLTAAWLVNSLLLLPSLHYPMPTPLIFPGWTLVFEMFFYYLLTISLAFGHRHAVGRAMILLAALVGIGAVIGFHHPILILISNPITLEFALGCAIALGYARFGKLPALGLALLFTGAGLLVSTLFFGDVNLGNAAYVLDGSLSWTRLLFWGVPAAMITGGIAFLNPAIRSPLGRVGVYLGDASYSIYLFSMIAFTLFGRFAPRLGSLNPDAQVWLSWVVVVLAGVGCYRYIERPMLDFLTTRYRHPAVQSAP